MANGMISIEEQVRLIRELHPDLSEKTARGIAEISRTVGQRVADLKELYPSLPEGLIRAVLRVSRGYGFRVLADIGSADDLRNPPGLRHP